MGKRLSFILITGALLFFAVIIKLYSVSTDEDIAAVSARQSSYKIEVQSFLGNIYDSNGKKLLYQNDDIQSLAVIPSIDAKNTLKEKLSADDFKRASEYLSGDVPFLLRLTSKTDISDSDSIQSFMIKSRYQKTAHLSHIIGYRNSEGIGVSGIEKAFDDYLQTDDSKISLSYKTNAVGNILQGGEIEVDDKEYLSDKGVVLTIDDQIQSICENVARKYITKGAVVVTSVPSCEIRAMLSLPDFLPDDISSAVCDSNSPLLNRALSPYDVGSIFKIVTAATALEMDYDENTEYDCKGKLEISGRSFACFDTNAHGNINLQQAFAYSCNGYFIQLANSLSSQDFAGEMLKLARNLGFGKEIELADGIISESGTLPTEEELLSPSALSNFSFGQGKLLATPLQINAMVNVIANKGHYYKPTLVKSLIDENKSEVYSLEKPIGKTVVSFNTAERISDYMSATVEYGTGTRIKSDSVSIAVKTGTAQTGQIKDGMEVEQCWVSGFFPCENPKFVVTVLAEGGGSVSESAAPVFKEIAESIKDIIPG